MGTSSAVSYGPLSRSMTAFYPNSAVSPSSRSRAVHIHANDRHRCDGEGFPPDCVPAHAW